VGIKYATRDQLCDCTDPMTDARSGSSNTLGSLGIITIGGAVGLVAVFFVVQCYRGWQRWSKTRQSGGKLSSSSPSSFIIR